VTQPDVPKYEKPEFLEKIILNPHSKPMAMFILLIILFALISTLLAAYFACFGPPESEGLIIFDAIMEVCFITDIVRTFLTQYVDPRDPRKRIRDLVKIARNYVQNSFFFDFVACLAWPVHYAVQDEFEPETASMIYLLRLLRLGKILILMNLQVFTSNMRSWFRHKLIKTIENQKGSECPKTKDNTKIKTQILLIKGFQVFRLLLFILILSYFLGTLWYIMTKQTTKQDDEWTFYNAYNMEDRDSINSLSIVVYFMLTTLTTVGFGDYNPKSEMERIIMTFILLIGVACFSWIMSQFMDILV